VQPWPHCSFARLREILIGAGCRCEIVIQTGAAVDLNGDPTPGVYGFTRVVDGEWLLAPVVAFGESDYMSANEIRSACRALKLDTAIFGTQH